MRLAIVTPVVTLLPGAHARWEEGASIDDVARVAETADRLGYDHLTCSEHIAVPAGAATQRGARYWDPLATFGYLAARTRQIRLATFVLVLGYHHPLDIVKRYGTLDQISDGRVVLGVGVGTLREEFDLIGAPFADRGARADDALRALRAALPTTDPAYEGEHYRFRGMIVDPCARQQPVPIWIGGRTLRSLRRAVTYADGWCPFGVPVATAGEWLARMDTPAGFEVVLSADRPLDPMADPDRTHDVMGAMAAVGTTIVSARFIHHSLDHYLEQLEALAEVVKRTPA